MHHISCAYTVMNTTVQVTLMDGKQIENLLQLIDVNIDLTRGEVVDYIRENQDEMIKNLSESGFAVIKTKFGTFNLAPKDLELSAA